MFIHSSLKYFSDLHTKICSSCKLECGVCNLGFPFFVQWFKFKFPHKTKETTLDFDKNAFFYTLFIGSLDDTPFKVTSPLGKPELLHTSPAQ